MSEQFHEHAVFGRSDIAALLEIQSSSASKLIKKLLDANIIEPVIGHRKGKYKFPENNPPFFAVDEMKIMWYIKSDF